MEVIEKIKKEIAFCWYAGKTLNGGLQKWADDADFFGAELISAIKAGNKKYILSIELDIDESSCSERTMLKYAQEWARS